jgi:protein involved in polysaccharide export with SLBB domain
VNATISGDRQSGLDFQLQDGDTVAIRKNRRTVYVFGEVLHQGRLAIPEDRKFRVTDALALSGGLASTGTLRRIYLARPGPDGHFKMTQFNLDEYIKDGKQAANPELQPDDVLLFGQPRQTIIASVTQVIGSLLFIDSIYGSSGLSTTLKK